MVLSMSCIGCIDGIAKYLAQSLSGLQVAWSYFWATFANLVVLMALRWLRTSERRLGLPRTRVPALQVARAGCLVLSLACLFSSLAYLELAQATVVSFTSPLFIVALAAPVLGEQVTWQRWTAVLIGLLGAVLVVRPGTAVFQWAALLPLLGAVFFASFHILTRMIGARDPPLTTLFYSFLVGGSLLSTAMPSVWRPLGALELALAYLTGVLGLLAHGALVRALTLVDASSVAPINYIRLVSAITIGYLVFAEVPDTLTLAGGAVIVLSGLYVLHTAAGARRSGRAWGGAGGAAAVGSGGDPSRPCAEEAK